MNEYELALVVNARIEDDARAAVVEKAKGYITRFGGEIGEIEEWGKQKLAYEIQKMTEGYYYFIPFTAGPDCPNELEKNMRIMDNVLRYLIVRTDEEDEFHRAPAEVTEEAEEAAEAAAEITEAAGAAEEAAEAVAEAADEVAGEVAEAAEEIAEAVEEVTEAVEAAEEAAE